MSAGRSWRGEHLLTADLRLRPPVEADIPALVEIANDPEIARWTAQLPNPYDAGHAMEFIAQANSDRLQNKDIVLLIERLADGKLAGVIHLSFEDGTGRLGYWIARRHWKLGYATQAVRRMARLAFRQLGLARLVADVMADNRPSCRVLEKAGFTASQVESRQLQGRCRDVPVTRFRLDLDGWNKLQADKPLLLVSAAALIDVDNRVLLACRPEGKAMAGLWEFPGGKIHAGESPEAAMIRELKEELGIDASESCLAPLAFASHDYDSFHLLMPLFVLRQWQGEPHPHEGQKLAWVRKDRLNAYPMPPADLPLVPILKDWL